MKNDVEEIRRMKKRGNGEGLRVCDHPNSPLLEFMKKRLVLVNWGGPTLVDLSFGLVWFGWFKWDSLGRVNVRQK